MVDVELPIDVVVMTEGEVEDQRFEADELAPAHDSWHDHLHDALLALPIEWSAGLLPMAGGGR